jgi:RimJ/RimL family protein N-acetyltransferase
MNTDTTKIFSLQPIDLKNDLVQLVPVRESDFDELFAVASDPLIWLLHPKRDRYTRAVFQQYFDSAVSDKSAFLVYEVATMELIGCTRYYAYEPAISRIAIGFTFLATRFWGGLYNQSMKKLMLDYAFKYVNSVVFHIGATNYRSQRAIEKMGAVKIREFDAPYNDTVLPHFEYEIKKASWASIQ